MAPYPVAHAPMLKPLHDWVLVRPDGIKTQTAGGLYLPPPAEVDPPNRGEVIAVGPGGLLPSGVRVPCSVLPGERVMYGKYEAMVVEVDGENLVMMHDTQITAIL